jgi:hypothetical protein
MPKKSFVLMMLLAASLIGIGSAANHQPEVAVTQPQPQLRIAFLSVSKLIILP